MMTHFSPQPHASLTPRDLLGGLAQGFPLYRPNGASRGADPAFRTFLALLLCAHAACPLAAQGEAACSAFLLEGECAQYQQRLAAAGSEEIGRIEAEYQGLVAQRKRDCRCVENGIATPVQESKRRTALRGTKENGQRIR